MGELYLLCSYRRLKPGAVLPTPPAPFLLDSVGSEATALGDWTLIFLHPGQLEADAYGSTHRPAFLSCSSEGVKLALGFGKAPVRMPHPLLSQSFFIWESVFHLVRPFCFCTLVPHLARSSFPSLVRQLRHPSS